MNFRVIFAVISICVIGQLLYGQNPDSIKNIKVEEITITSYRHPSQEIKFLPSVNGTLITEGKKSELITIQDAPLNIAEKSGRQIFGKLPGAFVYDMDGAGNQINIATRGLDPHRSWEYYVSQNGITTNSDIYGYPASHYSAPLESVKQIEIVRGTAALQYGAQFGGAINYVTKQADTTKTIGGEAIFTAGSFGLMSGYVSIGGKIGKWQYNSYYQRRVADGYRDNAKSDAQAQFISVQGQLNSRWNVKAELGRSTYTFRIPGPLTDAQFNANPKQATRSRNYFNPDIYVPSITLQMKAAKGLLFTLTSSAILGARNSIQFIGFADQPDTILASTLQYKNRQVDIDNFHSYNTELKARYDHSFLGLTNVMVAGIRYTQNDLHRRQQGVGTTGTDFDLNVTNNYFGRDIHFKTKNIAFFVENLFKISQRFSVSPGFRVENGKSDMTGRISYLPDEKIPQQVKHYYVLPGISSQFSLSPQLYLYAGYSQAYRPVVLADLIPGSVLEQNDPNIKDAFGYNAEAGIKGKICSWLNVDITAFQLKYNNRIGSLILYNEKGEAYIYKTNIGNSLTNGLEWLSEFRLLENQNARISIFSATTYMQGKYTSGQVRNGNENISIKGNQLETVPIWISRNGLQLAYKKVSCNLQYSYVSSSYSDALNTKTPSANGARGLVPAYDLWDFNLALRINPGTSLKLSLNNLTNELYFTKRPTGYPGQGVWPSDGRSINAAVSIKF
ncbi:MAG: TonB-dependent receptor [Saprospiraceae bacterium]